MSAYLVIRMGKVVNALEEEEKTPMVDSNEKKLIKWIEEKNIKAQMVNDDIFQRSHRLHRWVPLVFAQKIFLSNETQCIAYKEKESCFHFVYQWSLCLKCSLPFRCRSFVLLVFLFIFILRRNVMLNRVASCISKVRRWQFFVWKPYFRWSCTLLDAKRQLQTVIKNPFFTKCTHTCWSLLKYSC